MLGQKTCPVTITILFLLVFPANSLPPCLLHSFSSVFCPGKIQGSSKHSFFLPHGCPRGSQTGEWKTDMMTDPLYKCQDLLKMFMTEDQCAYNDIKALILSFLMPHPVEYFPGRMCRESRCRPCSLHCVLKDAAVIAPQIIRVLVFLVTDFTPVWIIKLKLLDKFKASLKSTPWGLPGTVLMLRCALIYTYSESGETAAVPRASCLSQRHWVTLHVCRPDTPALRSRASPLLTQL